MAFEKLENKINKINKKIKQGRLSQEIADEIGADYYSEDAMASVTLLNHIFDERGE